MAEFWEVPSLYTLFSGYFSPGSERFYNVFTKGGGGEESPWLPSTVSVTKVPEPVEGPRTPSPRGTPPKTPFSCHSGPSLSRTCSGMPESPFLRHCEPKAKQSILAIILHFPTDIAPFLTVWGAEINVELALILGTENLENFQNLSRIRRITHVQQWAWVVCAY